MLRPTANFEIFEIHLYFVSLPAVRPGCTRCRAPEISHNKGNGGGFTKMLIRRRFTYCAMAIPFILHSLPCSSIFLQQGVNYSIYNLKVFAFPKILSGMGRRVLQPPKSATVWFARFLYISCNAHIVLQEMCKCQDDLRSHFSCYVIFLERSCTILQVGILVTIATVVG